MKLKKSASINHLWANLIIEELLRNGVEYFCVAPGSRSSSLALAIGSNPKAKSFVHFDERGLAFHALGYVAATKHPCAIITTSGTAVANLFPAIIEASKKKLPLIVITADRPPELRLSGANQTIDQVKIFGEYVRWQFDLPCPTEDIQPEFVLTTIDQAVYRAQGRPPGPVHLNCMLREPLAPVKTKNNFINYLNDLKVWRQSNKPYTSYTVSEIVLSENSVTEIIRRINRIKNGLIVVGKLGNSKDREATLKLSEKLNWPILADISSGLRLGGTHKNIIHYFDQILHVETRHAASLQNIDGVIHLGGRMTSKRLSDFLEKNRPKEYIMILNHPLRHDPHHQVSLRVESSVTEVWKKIEKKIKHKRHNGYLMVLQKANQTAQKSLDQLAQKNEALSEPSVARLLSECILPNSGLFIGNSLAIREMDMFASSSGPSVEITANRGASGIDGNIASACGFALGLNKPVTVLTGDLALLHDLNSLAMTREMKKSFVVVVLNNNGGGVFSFLPIADSTSAVFERFFGTPHGFTFEHAAKMFHLNYAQAQTKTEFIDAYRQAQNAKTPTIIEIKTDRASNVNILRRLQSMIATAVQK